MCLKNGAELFLNVPTQQGYIDWKRSLTCRGANYCSIIMYKIQKWLKKVFHLLSSGYFERER